MNSEYQTPPPPYRPSYIIRWYNVLDVQVDVLCKLETLIVIQVKVAFISNKQPLMSIDEMVHFGQCKRTGGCYNELVVAFFSTGGGVKSKKNYTC